MAVRLEVVNSPVALHRATVRVFETPVLTHLPVASVVRAGFGG